MRDQEYIVHDYIWGHLFGNHWDIQQSSGEHPFHDHGCIHFVIVAIPCAVCMLKLISYQWLWAHPVRDNENLKNIQLMTLGASCHHLATFTLWTLHDQGDILHSKVLTVHLQYLVGSSLSVGTSCFLAMGETSSWRMKKEREHLVHDNKLFC
jgi:hypothetical protein